jgi:hypothetical protein
MLATYFNVDFKSYHTWLRQFKPFGHHERFDVGSVNRKRKLVRLAKGTEVPSPMGDPHYMSHHKKYHASRPANSHLSMSEAVSVFMCYALTTTACYHTLVTPKTYSEACKSTQREEWRASMHDEYESLIKMGTWKLVERTRDMKPIGSMWAYRIKENPDGSVSRFKSRLVARGDQQKQDSYAEIFAPVIKFVTLRILLALVAALDLECHQADISNAYCNASLTGDKIFMRQPAGFECYGPRGEELVCELSKSLYGLKQAGRVWNNMLNGWLISVKCKEDPGRLRFTRCRSDYSLYYCHHKGTSVIVGVYVDDLIIISNKLEAVNDFKARLKSKFDITDMGDISWILGMKVVRDRSRKRLHLHQQKYAQDILELFRMHDAKPSHYPAAPGVRLSKEDPDGTTKGNEVDATHYRSMVGKLVYLMVGSEPSIAFAVGQLSRFFSCPVRHHLEAAKLALRYVKSILKSQGLTFRGDEGLRLYAYCDSDWAGCPDTRRSTSGYVVMFCGAAVAWISKRQPTVALSSAEAEYVTACFAAQEVQWIRQLIAEIGIPLNKRPTTVYSDSQSAMHMAANPTAGRAKHMDIKYHFAKEAVQRGVVKFQYVSTTEQAADGMTKGLPGPKTIQFRDLISGCVDSVHMEATSARA